MKKTTIISVILIIAAFLIGYGWGAQKQERSLEELEFKGEQVEDKDAGVAVEIGVIASLTGKGAARGESARQGLELALQKIQNSNILQDQHIELVYQDAPLVGGAKEAIAAFNQLTEIERVVAVIGPMGSSTSLAVMPLVDDTGIPTIVHTASARKVTQDNEYVFRLWTTAQSYADAITSQIQEYGYKKIAALSAISDNTIDLFNILDTKMPFIVDERVDPEVNDFRTQLTKVKPTDAEALFLNLFEGQIGVAAKQARELKMAIPLFTNSVMSAVELEMGAEALEGVWYPRFAGYNDQVKQEFMDAYGKEPANPESAASAHDALMILAQAVSEVGVDSGKIKDYLYIHSFYGSIGEFKFLESGDAVVPLKIKTVKDGQIVDLVE